MKVAKLNIAKYLGGNGPEFEEYKQYYLSKTGLLINPYFFHSKIEDDSISILKVELFFITENGTDKLYKTVYTKRKYVISDKGKFVMTSEEVSEKMEQ